MKELLARAEAVDAEEDAKYGKGVRGDELPEELRFRGTRLAKIKEAMAALEAEDRKQRNFTDPDSRIMKMGATKSFEQCYNAEAAVDAGSQVIVAADVTQDANDKKRGEHASRVMRIPQR